MVPVGKRRRKVRSKVAVDKDTTDDEKKSTPPVVDEAVADAGDLDMPDIDCGVTIERMKQVTKGLHQLIFGCVPALGSDFVMQVIEHGRKYEGMVAEILLENQRLKGRLDVLTSSVLAAKISATPAEAVVPAAVVPAAVVPAAAVNVVPAAAVTAAPIASAVDPVVAAAAARVRVSKPVETWSVVVRGKEGLSSKDVLEKVVGQVGPTLGVRVHEMKPILAGGAVIRTPTLAEREKLIRNEKFKEVGLEVLVNVKAGPRVVVSGVHTGITPDEFMSELFEMNFGECVSRDELKRKVRMVSKPWNVDTAGEVNVVLQGEEKLMEILLTAGRVYIKWFSFRTRLQDSIPHCFRCLGFDHRIRECRSGKDVCRRCGMGGHMASSCSNLLRCRNCEFKGLPADHSMFSYSCPIYAALVARANARH